jgi:hypothetical protein
VSTLEKLERIAQRLEEASELAPPSRSVEYLAGAATVRAEIRSQRRGEQHVLWHRLEAVSVTAERLAESAATDSEEQLLADAAILSMEGLREEEGL